MKTTITTNLNLNDIENLISNEAQNCEFWGDLDLTIEEYEILGGLIRNVLTRESVDVGLLCKTYPHSLTTFMVFFAIYKYDTNFWSVLAQELGITIKQAQQEELGECAKVMFSAYSMDYSETDEETRTNIAPILYESCLPPDKCIDDLFYILSDDSYNTFDPQIIIDDLINMRSYSIRKPLLRFLSRFKNDRAIDYILEVCDSIISVEQSNSAHSRYTDSYSEWLEKEKSKSGISSRKDKDHQTKPYLFFDEKKKGLSILLPRIIVDSEWIETARWIVSSKNGFERTVECRVFGDEGRRFTSAFSVPVPPADVYTVKLQDSEEFDDKPMKTWEVIGIPSDSPVWFNNNGRQINANYIMYPYGILILRSNITFTTREIGIENLYYPNQTNDYRIMCVTPLGSKAHILFDCQGKHIELLSRPQINLSLSGKKLFGVENSNMFTEIPKIVIEVEGVENADSLELRIGNTVHPIMMSDESITIDLSDCFAAELNKYGAYRVRLYRRGRFIKQVEFNYVPFVQSDYTPRLLWPSNRKELSIVQMMKFRRLDGWELSFEGCDVRLDEEYYMVYVSSSVGEISIYLQSITDELSFHCGFKLPVNPFEYEIVSMDGDVVEKSSKLYRTDVKNLTEGEKWFSLHTYGEFATKRYKLALKTVNGIEQEESIKLNNKGSAYISITAFYDTIRNRPLPLEIVLICEETPDNPISVVYVSESNSFTVPVKAVAHNYETYVVISAEDENKDLDVIRFGFNRKSVHLNYSDSKLSKDRRKRGYPFPSALMEGIYIVSCEKTDSVFDLEEDNISFGFKNNIMYVRCSREDKRIKNSKHLLDLMFNDIMNKATADELRDSQSYKILTTNMIKRIDIIELDNCDIERLVALAYIQCERIENSKKELLSDLMRRISVMFMKRDDRYRIIELLIELDVPQEVFDACLKGYSLLLEYSDNPDRQDLAGKILKYSPELSMIMMMSTDGSIRDCMWKEKYIDIIGKDAMKHFLSIPAAQGSEEIATGIRRFVREESNSGVVIHLGDEIAGNANKIQKMLTYDKYSNPVFDITRKPDYGICFYGMKYVDHFVSWYRNTHNRNGEINPKIRALMSYAVEEYGDKLIDCIKNLNKHNEWKRISKEYLYAVEQRTVPTASTSSYGWFFYLQGIAAFLTRLPISRLYDSKRRVGIKFMSVASVVDPSLSTRDILMAQVYLYLKRKEDSLCQ